MPPPTHVCTACKASKVRCHYWPGETCERCKRLNLRCEEAPTKKPRIMAQFSLQTASTWAETDTAMAPAVVSTAPDNFDLSVRQVTFGGSPNVTALFWREVCAAKSTEAELFCLRHFAAIARRRNAHSLMMECVRTCESRGFKLTDLDPPMPNDDWVSDGGRQESPHPLEMLQVVSASRGYCMVRTVTRSGSNHFVVNAAFELGVCR